MKVRVKAVFHSWLAVVTIAGFLVAGGVAGAQLASAAPKPPGPPDVRATKSVDKTTTTLSSSTVANGDYITYTITAHNGTGNELSAINPSLTETVPTGNKF